MTLRKGHGEGAKQPLRIEVLPPDELPAPVPAEAPPLARRPDGSIADSATAKTLGARGGAAKASKRKLLQGLGLGDLSETDAFAPYYRAVSAWVEMKLADLATQCGGYVGVGPASIIGTAGVQLAASRFYSDLAQKDPIASMQMFVTASRLGEASRQSLLAAYELGVREAKARAEIGAKANDAFTNLLAAAADSED